MRPAENPLEWRPPKRQHGGRQPGHLRSPLAFLHDTTNLAYAVLDAPVLQELSHIRASLEQVEA
jgi:hypothetical protein